MKLTIFVFVLMLFLAVPGESGPVFNSSGVRSVAQGKDGTIWAKLAELPQSIYSWTNGTWTRQDTSGTDGFYLQRVIEGDDGAVYALWQKQGTPPQCLITVHRGFDSHVLVRFDCLPTEYISYEYASVLFAAGAAGDAWFGDIPSQLRHILPDGTMQTYPLEPEQYFGGTLPSASSLSDFCSMVDGSGRRWFWQNSTLSTTPQGTLRGVLIWNGKTLDYHARLTGLPDLPVTHIMPLDNAHVWVSSGGTSRQHGTSGALYQMDTRTLTATMERQPKPGAFQNIEQTFQECGDWYAVDSPLGGSASVLWRRHNGVWRICVAQLETAGRYYDPTRPHPYLAEPTGIWIGAGREMWWLPPGTAPPLRVDWRRGSALDVSSLFPLPNGRVLASGEFGTSEMEPTPQPVCPLPTGVTAGEAGGMKYLGPFIADARKHLWATNHSPGQNFSLREWDGRRWIIHPLPADIKADPFACDTLGRLWLSASKSQPSGTAVGSLLYDPIQDKWTPYFSEMDAFKNALQAAAAGPDMAFLPNRSYDPLPVFSGDGRVADNSTYGQVSLYDGKIWRQWHSADIYKEYSAYAPTQAHFNRDGILEVSIGPALCQWTSETGWRRLRDQWPTNYQNLIPPGGPPGLSGYPVADDLGLKWFVWQGAVYTAGYGLWAKQPELSALGSPFRAGYTIEGIQHDPAGHVFFVCRPAGDYDLVVWSPPEVLKPTLAVTPTSEDSVGVRLQTGLKGTHWFLWRLNSGAWSVPTPNHQVMLTTLAHGDYRVEVETLDSRLQRSPSAVAVFSIRVATNVQIAHWVSALLKGTENARESAVAGLVKQGVAALPALQAARSTATEDRRWWIDATIQQIQDQKQSAD